MAGVGQPADGARALFFQGLRPDVRVNGLA